MHAKIVQMPHKRGPYHVGAKVDKDPIEPMLFMATVYDCSITLLLVQNAYSVVINTGKANFTCASHQYLMLKELYGI